ncbi:hypothetical protein J6590_105023, partial [Homalodisca vitripennis]
MLGKVGGKDQRQLSRGLYCLLQLTVRGAPGGPVLFYYLRYLGLACFTFFTGEYCYPSHPSRGKGLAFGFWNDLS